MVNRSAATWLAAIGVWTGAVLFAQTPSEVSAWHAQMKAADKSDDSEAAFRDLLRQAESFGESDLRLLQVVVRMAELCEEDCGDKHPDYLDRALKLRANVKRDDLPFADLLLDLALLATQPGHYDDALHVYEEAIGIRERRLSKSNQKVAEAYAAKARAYQSKNEPGTARETMRYALQIRKDAGAEETEGYARLLLESARLYDRDKKNAAARDEFNAAVALYERIWKPGDARLPAALRDVASENRWGYHELLAEKLYRRILELQKQWRPNREEHYQALTDLAGFLQQKKHFADAEALYLDAVALRGRMGKADTQAAICMREVAECRFARGLNKEAIEAGEASLTMYGGAAPANFGVLSLYSSRWHLRQISPSTSIGSRTFS